MKCPVLTRALIIADDAVLAARLSSAMARKHSYLPVIDGPRIQRPDADAEVARRNNVAARVQPQTIVFAGVQQPSIDSFGERLPPGNVDIITSEADLDGLLSRVPNLSAPLTWGRSNIGLGLLTALRSGKPLRIDTTLETSNEAVLGGSGHLVALEVGNELTEVIAANYAYSMDASMATIPAVERSRVDQIMERFYSLYEDRERSPTEQLAELQSELREMCGKLPVPAGGSITFFTSGLPYGVAFPEVPSTHLRNYPDLGICVANGFAAEQDGAPGVECAVFVDPGATDAPEMEPIAETLVRRRTFVRGYSGNAANVRDVSDAIEFFPYDLLLIATHCGDADGYRWTYEFEDSEGLNRRLVVDIALGIARTDDPEILRVTQQEHFRSLDGVDWDDPERSQKIRVGSAMVDWVRLTQQENLEPIERQSIPRVVNGTVLKMYDNNYLPVPRDLAGGSIPIVINNACVSWHNLSDTFVFSGARAYVGTLISVTTSEASEIVTKVMTRHYGKVLPHAFWSAQRDAYGEGPRRPYVVSGVFPQRLRGSRRDVPRVLMDKLDRARKEWRATSEAAAVSGDSRADSFAEVADYYDAQSSAFAATWSRVSTDASTTSGTSRVDKRWTTLRRGR